MTCIVGLEYENGVVIGGDAAAISEWRLMATAMPKVFRRGPFIVGYTSSFRMGQLLEHHLDVRPQDEGEEADSYMVTAFVPAVRACLKEGGFARRKDEAEEGGQFLVGYQGRLYAVDSDYQILRFQGGYAAVGVGDEVALGSLFTARRAGKAPLDCVHEALTAAAEHNIGVSPPFTILQGES